MIDNPLNTACEECGAAAGEPCRPLCVGHALHVDQEADIDTIAALLVGNPWAPRADRACPCEHARHGEGSCAGVSFHLEARAQHVGAVCDQCAVTCVSDYLTAIAGLTITSDARHTVCHVGPNGLPACQGHQPQLVDDLETTVAADTGEILADFHGPGRDRHARLFALAWSIPAGSPLWTQRAAAHDTCRPYL